MLIYQSRIYRSDLKANRHVLYVFGDNRERAGLGGQAKEMRGEPNAVGVATKWRPLMDKGAFFSEQLTEAQKKLIAQDLQPVVKALKEGRVVVWPLDGIGTGLSELPTRAPSTWKWLERVRAYLETL